nr:homeodomain-like protein [Tanacetum cinerariifolium]
MHTVRGDGVVGIKRRRRDLYGDGVRNLVTASGRSRLKEDLESFTWRRCQDFKVTPRQTLAVSIAFKVVFRCVTLTNPFFAMENVNPPPNNCPVLTGALRARAVQVLHKLQIISAFVDSCLESIEQFLNNFANHPNETDMNDLESDDKLVDTPLVSPFPYSDNDLDDGEVLNELIENENVGMLCSYNTIMVEGLESTEKNLVSIVRDVYMFVGSFIYITDFMVLEDIGEFILINKVEVMMGKPFTKITKLEYDYATGLMSFNRIFDNYTFQMPRTILRFKRQGHISWSKIPPILVLSQRDLTNGFKNAYEKNEFMYKNCLNLGLEYQVDESMKEWLIHGHASIYEVT